ncbi:LuxR C-terminal-related transcriptional regulator [Corynebacterium breve]|uniref:LuxR C-terminal-related transcriptional regulator n=1 Tax=Corynebacterium breve TaxID=3049799 RepID=A0ABY8VDL3_9CORY|nr:LuxR family transcriptional regulator [Corynebacterium breve]WIM67192.1 LuxR C-terminal-related transcriptional regulator [Corynebacterium breve]
MVYSAVAETQRVIERIVDTPPGSGTIVIVSGPGVAGLLDKVIRSIRGFTIVRAQTMPWRTQVQGWVRTDIEKEVGSFDTLDDDTSAHVVIVDNAQWADESSLHELVELARSTRKGRFVLLLATTSTPALEAYAPLADLSVTLPPLGIEDISALSLKYRGVHLTPDVAHRVLEVTGGHLTLVKDILDAAPEDHWRSNQPYLPLPAHWRVAFEKRTRDLELGEVLQVVSQCSDLEVLQELVTNSAHISAAFTSGLIQAVPEGSKRVVIFTNPTDLAVMRASTPPAHKRDIHRRAAAWYRRQANETGALIHEAYALPGTSDSLATQLIRRAREVSADGNYRQAFKLFRLAARTAQDSRMVSHTELKAIESLIADSDIPRAHQYTLQLRTQGADPQIDSIRGYLALHEGRRYEAKTLMERSWSTMEARSIDDHELRAGVASQQVLLSLCEWQPEKLLGWAHTVGSWASQSSPAYQEAYYVSLIGKAAVGGTMPEGSALPWETPIMAQRRHMAKGWISLVHDDATSALQHLTSVSTGEGSERIATWMDAWLARTHLLLGDLDQATASVERGLARAERFGIQFLEPLLLWTSCIAANLRGDNELTRMYSSRLTLSNDVFPIQQIPSAMARLHLAMSKSDFSSALRVGQYLSKLDKETDTGQPGFWPWRDLWGNALVHAGRLDEAEEEISKGYERCRDSPVVSSKAKLHMTHGRLLLARGDVDRGVKLFDEAVEMIEPLNLPLYSSRIFFEYGQALRRLGKRRLADDCFARAGEQFAMMGADFLVERCNRERRASGLGTRGKEKGMLTPQEMEIATLVAQGATNKEAAAELFLSAKTVEYHLTRVYQKLAIRNRSELARALTEL